MTFTELQLETLRKRVKNTLGDFRYRHTLGVEKTAVLLGEIFCPSLISELRCAALLHDITKELSSEASKEILLEHHLIDEPSLWQMPAVFHSLTAPVVIQSQYPEYATENILSAVQHHTVGDPCMSLFDKIIFIADYIEENRSYPSCVSTRSALYQGLENESAKEQVLNRAVLSSIDATLLSLISSGRPVCLKTVQTRNAILTELSQE